MSLTTIVIPVRDEDPSIVKELVDSLRVYGWPIIVVDDGSQTPVMEATIRFPSPRGYGAALKVGMERATTDLVCTMDGDGQHMAWDVKRLEDFFFYFCNWYDGVNPCHPLDMVVGDRRLHERGRRYWGRKGLNWLASLFAGRFIPDLNSGLRIFRRNIALGYSPILCDGFSFTTSLTLAMMADGYAVDFLPIQVWTRHRGMSKVHLWRDGWRTLRTILWIGLALRTRRLRAWIRNLR